MPLFSQDFDVISIQKKMVFSLLHTEFSVSFRWSPKAHGPRGHCPPCPPPYRRPCPQSGIADFCRTKVLPDIFNRLNFEYSAFSGLKVDSGRRKRKKKVRKKMQKKVFNLG